MSSPQPLVLVVAAAIVDDLDRPQRLLAARRRKPVNLAGRWEFPGGKVDVGETPVDALHRELLAELGVRVQLGAEVSAPGGSWQISPRYTMRLWAASIADGQPEPLVEHDELRWLEPDHWLDVAWLDPDVPIVRVLADQARGSAGLR